MNRSLIWFAFVLLGCTETVESADVRTSGIYPEITVTADASGQSTVEVLLKVGGDDSNTFLELTGDDRLEATADGETKTLDKSGSSYEASFDMAEEGTEFTIAFLRGDEDDDAPDSTVELPAPFDLELETTEASRAEDDIEFSWEPPANGEMAWAVRGDCIFREDDETPDDGMHTISHDEIRELGSKEDESCTVRLTLERSRLGSIDPAFTEGGFIEAIQVRQDSFTSVP